MAVKIGPQSLLLEAVFLHCLISDIAADLI